MGVTTKAITVGAVLAAQYGMWPVEARGGKVRFEAFREQSDAELFFWEWERPLIRDKVLKGLKPGQVPDPVVPECYRTRVKGWAFAIETDEEAFL